MNIHVYRLSAVCVVWFHHLSSNVVFMVLTPFQNIYRMEIVTTNIKRCHTIRSFSSKRHCIAPR